MFFLAPQWTPNVTVGSNRPKNSVPEKGIEPWSLAFRASIITARPPRQLSAVTISHFQMRLCELSMTSQFCARRTQGEQLSLNSSTHHNDTTVLRAQHQQLSVNSLKISTSHAHDRITFPDETQLTIRELSMTSQFCARLLSVNSPQGSARIIRA